MDRTPSDPTFSFDAREDRLRWPIPCLFREYGAGHGWILAVAAGCSIVYPLLSLLPVFVLQTAIDAVLLDVEPFALPGIPTDRTPTERLAQLYLIVVILLAAALSAAAVSALGTLTWGRFAQEVQHVLRTDAYARTQRLRVGFFDDQQSGQLLSILNNDVENLDRLLERFLKDMIETGVRFLGIALVLLVLHWQLALLALTVLPFLAVTGRYFVSRIRPMHQEVRSRIGELNARIENNLGGIRVIKAFTGESFEADRVESASRAVFETRWELVTTKAVFVPAMSAINWMAFGALLAVGGYWHLQGPPVVFTQELTVGTLVAFLLYNQQLTTPMMQASHLVDLYAEARASAVRVLGLRAYAAESDDMPSGEAPPSFRGRVAATDVTFGYDDERVLEGVSFSIEPGSFVGIVGPTGAGKTTLVELLLRFHDPDQGRITVDGRDLRSIQLGRLRAAVALVSQEPYLFSGTVRENVAYPDIDVADEAVERALRLANAWEFVEPLPDGIDTHVGQRGVQLSGGQRQRIAIARAILTDPQILLLDEATSHVDNETEALIQGALREIAGDRTTIAVAHRLSTVRDADRILVVEDGRIVERGTHDSLVAADGLYADLWRVQVGEFIDRPEDMHSITRTP